MRPARPIPLVAAALALGCGSDAPPGSAPAPALVVVAQQEGTEQAETAVVVARAGQAPSIVIAFNDYTIDPSFPGGPEYALLDDGETIATRRGFSLMGWSVSRDGGGSYEYRGKVRPPKGWAAIWGDPSVAVDPSAPGAVYLADLAISDASWDGGAAGADTLPNPQRFSDGVCVARSTDGGWTFPDVACVPRPPAYLGLCQPGQSVCVDHTAIGVDGTGRLYLAAEVFQHDGESGALVHLWRAPSAAAWDALVPADPQPPAAVEIEPTIVTGPDGDVWIAGSTLGTPRDVGVNQQRAGDDGWSTNGYVMADAGVTDYTGGLEERIHTAPETSFRIGRTFALAVGAVAGKPHIGVVFSARRALDQSFYLGAVHCAAGLAGDGACVREPAWETASWRGQQLMPAMSANAGDPFRFDVAFLTDDRAPGVEGRIQVAARALAWSPGGGAVVEREERLTAPTYPVCARQSAMNPGSNYNGYWGDYFGTAQGVDAVGAPFSVTAFSDSRPGTSCKRGDRFADPLHVAAARW